MNRADEEFNKIVLETVNELMKASTENYEEIRLTLLSRRSGDQNVDEYVKKLFEYTDKYRPLQIGMRGDAV